MAKGASKSEREQLRRAMADAGAGVPEVAAEMQRRFDFRPRESCRHAHGWSQDDAAHAYNRVAGAATAPMTGTRISAYECWPFSGERPSPKVLNIMARAYGVSVNQLVDFYDLEKTPSADRQLIVDLSTLDSIGRGKPQSQSEVLAANAPSRTLAGQPAGLNQSGTHATSERAFLMNTARESAAFAHHVGQTNVGPTDLDQLDADVDRISRDYLTTPLIPLLGEMRELRNIVLGLLDGRQYPKQTRHLYLLAAQACGLLASASSDLGQYDDADTHARTAWLCAELAEHNELRGWVLSTRSIIAFWAGRCHKAVEYAEQGIERVGRGLELVRLRSLEARARARLGDEAGARLAIQAAISARETAADNHEYQGMFAFPIANQERCTGSAYLWMRHPDEGRRSLEQALNHFEADAHPNEPSYAHTAVTRLDLTLAHLHSGDLDGAREAIGPVLDLRPALRLAGVLRRIEPVQRLLAGRTFRTVSAARSLSETIEDFSSGAALRHLPGATA